MLLHTIFQARDFAWKYKLSSRTKEKQTNKEFQQLKTALELATASQSCQWEISLGGMAQGPHFLSLRQHDMTKKFLASTRKNSHV